MKFKITTKDGRVFISEHYVNIRHIHENAFQFEYGIFCENNVFLGNDRISLIEPLDIEKDESK